MSELRIEIGAIPGRKAKALSVTEGSVTYPVAYFRDEESYERFCAAVGDAARLVWLDDPDWPAEATA